MQDIKDLERRITAALERIAHAVKDGQAGGQARTRVANPNAAQDSAAQNSALQDSLDEERMANAQLQERLRIVNEREAALRAEQGAVLLGLNQQHAAEIAGLTAQVEDLTRILAALRAERQAESAEITDIVAALNPLIEEARHA